MAYPFAGFGSFLFQRAEWPLPNTDTGWNRQPSKDQSRPLGSSRDSIVTLAVGSGTRTFECMLSPARYAVLAAMVNTTAAFTGWERPTPDTGSAFLGSVTQLGSMAVKCSDGTTERKIRTRVELISQA